MDWKEQFEIIIELASDKLRSAGLGTSLAGLERFLGVTRGKAAVWKRGQRPSADDLQRMAERLDLSPQWLLLGEGDPGVTPGPAGRPAGVPTPPEAPAPALPAKLTITRAVQGVEQGMRSVDAGELTIWRAVLELAQAKVIQLGDPARPEPPDRSTHTHATRPRPPADQP